jgi:hypothetical protein
MSYSVAAKTQLFGDNRVAVFVGDIIDSMRVTYLLENSSIPNYLRSLTPFTCARPRFYICKRLDHDRIVCFGILHFHQALTMLSGDPESLI